ncbi:MAG: cca, partial [Firmicutes bacterium]|nr:cca [Bacillota bacterium]
LKVNGRDLIDIGMKPGKEMGVILYDLLTEVLERPSLNERDTLLSMASERIKERKA